MARNKFSVIIPTFTGANTIADCFESILRQKPTRQNYDIIVVIDGENNDISRVCELYRKKFQKHSIEFLVRQLDKNQGRFIARQEGAKLSKSEQLLFLDDRITFTKNYFKKLSELNKKALIPNVVEAEAKNFISRCLYLLRVRVYGREKFGVEFKPYPINRQNFETSPKGTTSFWVKKSIFLKACKKIEKAASENKYINEDTKLFKEIIDDGHEIYRSSEVTINYQPRAGAKAEIVHIYNRGPRFVDYYINPRTRFFPLLLAILLLGLSVVSLSVMKSALLASGLVVGVVFIITFALFTMKNLKDLPVLIAGLPIILGAFSLGVYKGIGVWAVNRMRNK